MSDLIEAYLDHLAASGYSPETVRERGFLLRRADRELPHGLEVASVAELERWLATLRKLSRWTRATYWEDLWQFYVLAERRHWLDWNPMTELPRPRVPPSEPRPVTEEQLAIALTIPPPWRTAVVLAAFDGLRCAEIARLSREDMTAEWFPVLRKGGRVQMLPTHPLVWEAVEGLPPGPAVPRSRRSGHFVPKGLAQAVSKRLSAVGLVEVTLHWFRHRFATAALSAGADVRTVQELLGHASLASTQVYTQVVSAQRRAAVLALPVPTAGQEPRSTG